MLRVNWVNFLNERRNAKMSYDHPTGLLCGGILFSLMCEAKIRHKNSLNFRGMDIGALKEGYMFAGIYNIFTKYTLDIKEITQGTTISGYKSCDSDTVSSVDFFSEAFVSSVREGLLHHHSEILYEIKALIDTFLRSTKDAEILAKRYMNLLMKDSSLAPRGKQPVFYLDINNYQTPQSDISMTKHYYVECVIFAAFYHVFVNKIRNKKCKTAFNWWFKQHGASQSTYDFNEEAFYLADKLPTTYIRLPDFKKPAKDERKENLELIVSEDNPLLNSYGWYIEHAVEYYSQINTIINPTGIDFYSFYITCGVSNYDFKSHKETETLLESPTPNGMKTFGHRIALIADGGYGKTLFLKHMLLCDKRYGKKGFIDKADLIPVLINLNEYRKNKYSSFEEYAHRQVSRFDSNITLEKFTADLQEGIFLFLFDALDEIGDKDIMDFVVNINDFCSRYDKNYFIVSSRPTESCATLSSFRFLKLQPFNKEKAIRLIKKFNGFDSKTKEDFIAKLGHRLTDIEKNPLLLTIKFMVYANKNEFVDGDSYKFYQMAYETLYETHDKIESHYLREYKTGLDMKNFSKLMSEFCYYSFFNHEYSFEASDAEDIFEAFGLDEKYSVSVEDFLTDLQDNLCLVYIENDTYNFIHRSFQEYFAALFLSNQKAEFFKDEKNYQAIDHFSNGSYPQNAEGRASTLGQVKYMFDMTTLSPVFSHMLQMKPMKLVNYILLPKMKSVFGGNPDKPVDILTYLDRVYGNIECAQGNVEGEPYPCLNSDILEYIFSDIVNDEYMFHQTIIIHDAEDFRVERFYLMGYEKDNTPIYETDSTVEFNYDDPYDDRKVPVSGATYKIPVKTLIENREKYAVLIESLEAEFRDEYEEFLDAYKKLVKFANNKKPAALQ